MIRTDGYYISDGNKWTDWHAGHKFEGTSFYILIFTDENKVLRLSMDSKNFDIKKLMSESLINDSYKEFEKIIEIHINPKSKFSKKREFIISSPNKILDENLHEYTFVPFTNSDADCEE